MIGAPVAEDEFERLSTLLAYKILDSQPEIEYDDITQLASTICQTPVALVTLIDGNRQWFKSRIGVDFSESPRETSFCGHAIQGHDLFIVRDTLKDERFVDNPHVLNSNVRFYAGAPLVAPNGKAVGTLCVLDNKPRDLSPEQSKALVALSRQVVSQLELRKACHAMNENYETLRVLSKKVHRQEQMLIQTAKMAALGDMAAAAAHEVNNPLTIISGRADQILSESAKNSLDAEKVAKFTSAIHENVTRIARVVKALKSFSVPVDSVEKSKIHVSHIVENMVALYKERARDAKVKFKVDIHEDSVILCSQLQISQILLNLLNNAFDAVQKLDEKWIKISVSKTSQVAEIQIMDSGSGIPLDVRRKIMEPYFTTKPPGRGCGLGLNVSKNLVEDEGGTLELDHTQKNTCFIIKIPVAQSK